MRRRLLFTVAALVAAGLAAGAVPAFTADSGSVARDGHGATGRDTVHHG